jgi:hypothetical protein
MSDYKAQAFPLHSTSIQDAVTSPPPDFWSSHPSTAASDDPSAALAELLDGITDLPRDFQVQQLWKIQRYLNDRPGGRFPFSADLLALLFHPLCCESQRYSSNVFRVVFRCLADFPDAARRLIDCDIASFLASFLAATDATWFENIVDTFAVLDRLFVARPTFIAEFVADDPDRVTQIMSFVCDYQQAPFPDVLGCSDCGLSTLFQHADYLIATLPVLAKVLTCHEFESDDDAVFFFRRLRQIGANLDNLRHGFVPRRRFPAIGMLEGAAPPQDDLRAWERTQSELAVLQRVDATLSRVHVHLFRCLSRLARPAVVPVVREDNFHEQVLCWVHRDDDSLFCSMCFAVYRLLLVCVQNDPSLFRELKDYGLFDAVTRPMYKFAQEHSAPSADDFDGLLDFVIAVLCLIAAGAIQDDEFQPIVLEALKRYRKDRCNRRAKIVVAFAAALGKSDDRTKQRILDDFQMFPDFVDLLEATQPETVAILLRAIVCLINFMEPSGELDAMREVLAELDPATICGDVEDGLGDEALADLEALRQEIVASQEAA